MRGRRFAILGLLIIAGLCLTLFYSGWAALVAVTTPKLKPWEIAQQGGNPFDQFDRKKVCTYFDGLGFHAVDVSPDRNACARFERVEHLP